MALTDEQILAFARTHGMFGFVGTEQLQDFSRAIEKAAREAVLKELTEAFHESVRQALKEGS
jgi:hypothetical protein